MIQGTKLNKIQGKISNITIVTHTHIWEVGMFSQWKTVIVIIIETWKMTARICAMKLVVIVFHIIPNVTASPYNVPYPYSGKSESLKKFPD